MNSKCLANYLIVSLYDCVFVKPRSVLFRLYINSLNTTGSAFSPCKLRLLIFFLGFIKHAATSVCVVTL